MCAATLPCSNVLVENAQVLSHASSFKLGTESLSSFSNITVQSSVALPGTHRALSIQLRDSGDVSCVSRRTASSTWRLSATALASSTCACLSSVACMFKVA